MNRLIVYTACLVLLLSCQSQPTNLTADEMVNLAVERVTITTPEDVMKIMETEEVYTIIDVREKDEYYHGYIPGSVSIPRGLVEFKIGAEGFWENEGLYMPAKDEIIVIYCKKGNRSALAANSLQQMGYKKILMLDGGWKKWELKYPDYCEKNLEMLSGAPPKHDDGGGC